MDEPLFAGPMLQTSRLLLIVVLHGQVYMWDKFPEVEIAESEDCL